MKSRIVVLEPKPAWTPELQRQFHGQNIRVQQHTTAAEVLQNIGNGSVTVVVLPFDQQEATCMQLLPALFDCQPVVSSIVIGSPRTKELEGPVKELGATLFLPDRPTGTQLAQSCRRQLESLLA